ncbi:MAG: hypothetical protein AAGA03_17730 [Planctomycetota bacterium]
MTVWTIESDSDPLLAAQPVKVIFDLPSVVEADVTTDSQQPLSTHQASIHFRLSSLVSSAQKKPIDQWLIRCELRDEASEVIDYKPKTTLASDLASPIKVIDSDESSRSVGLSLDGHLPTIGAAHVGTDAGKKSSLSRQFERLPPLQAVTAAGTIRRGRGVYFKMSRTGQQVLDGEKEFTVVFAVPTGWRVGLIDVTVSAQSKESTFPGIEPSMRTIADEHFVLVACRRGDHRAAQVARDLASQEHELRRLFRSHQPMQTINSLPTLIHSVASKFDRDPAPYDQLLKSVLLDKVDPHLDQQLRRQPMPIRLAVIDYDRKRRRLLKLHREN